MTADLRFARQTAVVVYQMLTGQTVARDPPASTVTHAGDMMNAHVLQKQAIDAWALACTAAHHSLHALIQAIVHSPYFSVTDAAPGSSPTVQNIVGATLVHQRLLTPENLDRNIASLSGQPWTNRDARALP